MREWEVHRGLLRRLLLSWVAGVLPFCLQSAEVAQFQSGSGAPRQMGTFALANLDEDPQLEIIVAYQGGLLGTWRLDAFKMNGSRVPGFPWAAPGSINISPTIVDLDSDGRTEILFTARDQVIALNRNGTARWSQSISWLNYVPDAGFEAVTNGFYWSFSRLFVPRLPLTAEFSSDVSSPFLADLDGDGRMEVLTAWKIDPDTLTNGQDFNPFINDTYGRNEEWGMTGETWSGGVVILDPATGATTFTYHFHQLVEAGLAVGHLDSQAAALVYVLNDADGVAAFDRTRPPGLFGAGMLHKQFGKNQRFLSGSYETGVDLFAADLDGDGMSEVLVPSTQIEPNWQPSETILDDDGAIVWRKWKAAVGVPSNLGWQNNACMIPVNPDHDNHADVISFTQGYEIAFRQWDGINLVDRAGWPKSFYPLMPTPPVVGDVDGDGQEEIVLGLYDPASENRLGFLKVFNLAGAEEYSAGFPAGVKQIPAIADMDGDSKVDVVVRTLQGRVHVYNFGSKPDAAVSWSTHRGNMARDGHHQKSLFGQGTPIISSRSGGFQSASFSWTQPGGASPASYSIKRALAPGGPFTKIATLASDAGSFREDGLQNGTMVYYQVAAVFPDREVVSPPAPILPDLDGNLLGNPGFEENDNSHWDKWFTGDISWNDMTGSPANPHNGGLSMEIRLNQSGNNASIIQSSHYGAPAAYLPVTPGRLYSMGGFMRSGGLNCRSEHWLEWDSSITTTSTNRRPPLPWPNYFTPSLMAGAGEATGWRYLNRVFTMPPGFPNIELRHRFTVEQPATGSVFLDDLFVRELPAADSAAWQSWLSFGSTWRYSSATPAENWADSNFDDSSWPSGQAKFGAGTGPRQIKTPVPPKRSAYHFRKKFQIAQGAWSEVLIAATATDNSGGRVYPMELWINGRSVPSGGIECVSGEGNDVLYYDLAPFADYFQPGENSIAVKVNNVWAPDWDNVAFDLSVRAIPIDSPSSPFVRFIRITSNAGPKVTLNILGSGSWKLQSSPTQSLWIDVQALEFGNLETKQVELPAGKRTEFFRLIRN